MINTREEKYNFAPLRGLNYSAQGGGSPLQKLKKNRQLFKKHVCNKDTSQKNKFGTNSRHQPQNTAQCCYLMKKRPKVPFAHSRDWFWVH